MAFAPMPLYACSTFLFQAAQKNPLSGAPGLQTDGHEIDWGHRRFEFLPSMWLGALPTEFNRQVSQLFNKIRFSTSVSISFTSSGLVPPLTSIPTARQDAALIRALWRRTGTPFRD